jgi:A/G-specific adenine glycosylase
VMELGALVCTANAPRCEACPIADRCAWVAAGRPAYQGPARKVQTYAGTDRQCRGRLLAVLRDAEGSVDRSRLDAAWPDAESSYPGQRERALASLLDDGLVVREGQRFALP